MSIIFIFSKKKYLMKVSMCLTLEVGSLNTTKDRINHEYFPFLGMEDK